MFVVLAGGRGVYWTAANLRFNSIGILMETVFYHCWVNICISVLHCSLSNGYSIGWTRSVTQDCKASALLRLFHNPSAKCRLPKANHRWETAAQSWGTFSCDRPASEFQQRKLLQNMNLLSVNTAVIKTSEAFLLMCWCMSLYSHYSTILAKLCSIESPRGIIGTLAFKEDLMWHPWHSKNSVTNACFPGKSLTVIGSEAQRLQNRLNSGSLFADRIRQNSDPIWPFAHRKNFWLIRLQGVPNTKIRQACLMSWIKSRVFKFHSWS